MKLPVLGLILSLIPGFLSLGVADDRAAPSDAPGGAPGATLRIVLPDDSQVRQAAAEISIPPAAAAPRTGPQLVQAQANPGRAAPASGEQRVDADADAAPVEAGQWHVPRRRHAAPTAAWVVEPIDDGLGLPKTGNPSQAAPDRPRPYASQARAAMLQVEGPRDTVERPRSVDPIGPPARVTEMGPFEVHGQSGELKVVLRRSKLLRTKTDVYRTAVVDPSVCDVVQYTPREISIIGKAQGATDVTFWFSDQTQPPQTYLVRVVPDPEVQERREAQYDILEDILAELFPESKVKLIPVSDKLIVTGQARDAEEAAQILAVIRGEAVLNRTGAAGYGLVEGRAADPLVQEETGRALPAAQVINMLRIPGVQQVALRVKIAELNRSAARAFGVDLNMAFNWADGAILIQSLLNMATGNGQGGVISGTFDNGDINFGIHYLEQHGVVRMLSEPTLVTLSGRPATFLAGGEFAVPTTVGVAGAAAVNTDFRAYGAIVTFLPVVLDKDHIRLEVAPEFSQIDRGNSVGGTPGLTTRAVTTTVEMREGQTLAIAGLLDDAMRGDNSGDVPIIAQILGRREVTRNQTELIILVTPELIHPMEPEAVPPLPGFDVTEPTNCEFFIKGRLEGRPTHEYNSNYWPKLRRRYQAGGPAMISGPFGHGD